MARKIHLVIIDPQNSFCKVVDSKDQQNNHDGELCVTGAWEDMQRLAGLVDRLGKKISDIQVTLDSHHYLHIAHPIWFRSVSDGSQPSPFTLMRSKDNKIVGSIMGSDGSLSDIGEFTTVRPSLFQWTLSYLSSLNSGKRYPHCIWPPHCLIGTPGHNAVEPLMKSLLKWEKDVIGFVNFVTKGSNYRVEHFSAVRAEIVDPIDPSTQLNSGFIQSLMEADEILLAGEARSHCLANTVRDIANEFTDAGTLGNQDEFIKKCVLLEDASSDVPGFDKYGNEFVDEMTKRGMKTATCQDYLS